MTKVVKYVISSIAVLGTIAVLFFLGDLFFMWGLYSWFSSKILGFGLFPRPITGIVAFWCAAITFLQVPKLWSEYLHRKRERWTLRLGLLITPWLIFSYVMVHPPENWYFNPFNSKSLYKYTEDAEGNVTLYPIGYGYNFDPVTRLELKDITPEAAKKHREQKNRPRPRASAEDPPSTTASAGWRLLGYHYTVIVSRCKRYPRGTGCDLTIANTGAGADFAIGSNDSFAIDNRGEHLEGTRSTIAGKSMMEQTTGFFGTSKEFVDASVNVPGGTSISGFLALDGGSDEADAFQILQVQIACKGLKTDFTFKNITIEKADQVAQTESPSTAPSEPPVVLTPERPAYIRIPQTPEATPIPQPSEPVPTPTPRATSTLPSEPVPTPTPEQTPHPSLRSVTQKYLTFSLYSCSLEESSVFCEMGATNNLDQEVRFWLHGGCPLTTDYERRWEKEYSSILDDSGNEYCASLVEIGAQSSPGVERDLDESELPARTTVKLVARFPIRDSQPAHLQLLQVAYSAYQHGDLIIRSMDGKLPVSVAHLREISLDNGPAVSNNSLSQPAATDNLPAVRFGDFHLKRGRCGQSANRITCELIARNTNNNRRHLALRARTASIVDQYGKTHYAEAVRIGYRRYGSNSGRNIAGSTEMRIFIMFEPVAPGLTKTPELRLHNVEYTTEPNNREASCDVVFNDIRIERETNN